MEITWRQLPNITFPVYILPSEDVFTTNGLVYSGGRLIDDRGVEGDTLGVRRLRSPYRGLFIKFTSIAENISELLSRRRGSLFIDHKGKVFKYKKTVSSKVVYHRILKVEPKGDCSLLYLEGVRVPLRIPRPPPHGIVWAGVMYFKGYPWVLYEYSLERKPDARRMF